MKEKLARLRRLIEQLTLVLREERQENLRLRSRLASAQAELDQAQQRLKKLNAQIQQLNRLTNPAEFESAPRSSAGTRGVCCVSRSAHPLLLGVHEAPIQFVGNRGEVLLGKEFGAHEEAGHRGTQHHDPHGQRLAPKTLRGEGRIDEARVGGSAVLEAEHALGIAIQLGEEGRNLRNAERRLREKRLRRGGAAR